MAEPLPLLQPYLGLLLQHHVEDHAHGGSAGWSSKPSGAMEEVRLLELFSIAERAQQPTTTLTST
jgi:hypothetical protein